MYGGYRHARLPQPDSDREGLPENDRIAALQAFYLKVLEANVSMPGVSDLISGMTWTPKKSSIGLRHTVRSSFRPAESE
ncbi:hypothetical protein [Saccharibacillus deserti]|uniref:hypothetical protein n=1 Tax=Saccharibacillus deserti TaxID=1634444 RepID=UPI0015544953|nr:hypothetical protein [Saccharibacillus deserti]